MTSLLPLRWFQTEDLASAKASSLNTTETEAFSYQRLVDAEESPLNRSLLGSAKHHIIAHAIPLSPDSEYETSPGSSRLLLLATAFLYASSNVCLRLLHRIVGGSLSASALSHTLVRLTSASFVPILMIPCPPSRSRNTKSKPNEDEVGENCTTLLVEPEFDGPEKALREEGNSSKLNSFWVVATELSIYHFGAQGFLTAGLLYSRSSIRATSWFQISVILTPLLSAIAGQTVKRRTWLSCLVSFLGLLVLLASSIVPYPAATDFLLTADRVLPVLSGGRIPDSFWWRLTDGMEVGDVFCLLGAVFWSVYTLRLSIANTLCDEVELQGAKSIIMDSVCTLWFLSSQFLHDGQVLSLRPGITTTDDYVSWGLLVFTAIGPGALASILHQKAQTGTTASDTNVVLSLGVLFTSLLSFLLLGEMTSVPELILGGGLTMAACWIVGGP